MYSALLTVNRPFPTRVKVNRPVAPRRRAARSWRAGATVFPLRRAPTSCSGWSRAARRAVVHVHKINIGRRECTGELDLLLVLTRGVLVPRVRPRALCPLQPPGHGAPGPAGPGVGPLDGPRLALRHREPVQAKGGRDDADLDALLGGEDRRPLGFGLGTSRAHMRDLGPIKIIEVRFRPAKPWSTLWLEAVVHTS